MLNSDCCSRSLSQLSVLEYVCIPFCLILLLYPSCVSAYDTICSIDILHFHLAALDFDLVGQCGLIQQVVQCEYDRQNNHYNVNCNTKTISILVYLVPLMSTANMMQ